jgi:hypothetical protein
VTWNRVSSAPVNVQAWKNTQADGSNKVQLTIGTQSAQLSLEDGASLGGYLLEVCSQKEEQAQ